MTPVRLGPAPPGPRSTSRPSLTCPGRHVVALYVSETNMSASFRRAVPDDLLDFRPHEKTNTILTIFVHQILSERRFFAQFVGTREPAVEELLPAGKKPPAQAYIEKYVQLAKLRLPQLALNDAS